MATHSPMGNSPLNSTTAYSSGSTTDRADRQTPNPGSAQGQLMATQRGAGLGRQEPPCVAPGSGSCATAEPTWGSVIRGW